MSGSKSILIVEDEADLAEVIRFNLEKEGHRCHCIGDGMEALGAIREMNPDLLILDRMLPGISGDDIIANLRRNPGTAGTPVIMLTAKAEESDELVGFALGADDYITKPFSVKVLLARVEALFRRLGTNVAIPEGETITLGPITLDRSRHELTVDGKPVTLTSTEFGILWQLLAARGRVLSREQLIDAALGTTAVVTDRTIDVHIAALRKKLGSAAPLIQTVRGVGYTVRLSQGG
ncbi:MAG: response regulator [Planctomycetota bacterium]|jgi:two-component system phosphate regulon response regulator PhoB